MSTKIFNGYFYHGTILEAFNVFLGARKRFLEEATRLESVLLANLIAGFHDEAILKGETPRDLFHQAWKQVMDRQKKIRDTQLRDPAVDFDAEIVCYPNPVKGPKRKIGFLIRFLTEQKTHTAIWESIPGVIPYPYWNNTDQPKDVSDREWAHRCKVWDSAVDPGPGLSFPFCDYGHHGIPTSANIQKVYPSFDDRVKDQAHRQAADDKFKGQTDVKFSDVMEWLHSDEYKELVKKIIPEIETKLPRDIPREVLF